MFFLSNLEHTIFLPPVEQTSDALHTMTHRLYRAVEGTCNQETGFIIFVTEMTNVEGGQILNTGHALFKVSYKALLLKPIKGEVIDAEVADINSLGIFCEVGPLTIFVSNFHVPSELLKENRIQKEDKLRVRIIGTKIDTKKVYAIGSINEPCLGVISHF